MEAADLESLLSFWAGPITEMNYGLYYFFLMPEDLVVFKEDYLRTVTWVILKTWPFVNLGLSLFFISLL